MRVLVCGGRDFKDREAVSRVLDELEPHLIITGGATGADSLAQDWADDMGEPCMVFPPSWKFYDRAAGPVRNMWMLRFGKPDLVIAFPGGIGTENMIKLAEEAGVEVRRP